MITSIEIGWFAGLYEGEGSVNAERHRLTPRIILDSTDEDTIRRAATITGGQCYVYDSKKRSIRNPKWRDVFRLVVDGSRAIGWLMTIFPLLGERRQSQVARALTYWRSRVRESGGWAAHRARYGCDCQQNTGSCQRAVPLPPRILKTECKRGHAYTEANTIRVAGRRWCRACRDAAPSRRETTGTPRRKLVIRAVTITLPWSMVLHDNHRLMPVRTKKGARLITAPEYRETKLAAEWEIKRQWRTPKLEGELTFSARAFFPNRQRRDILNYRKLIEDAMTGIVYTDDSQIVRATWERAGIDRENPRIEITLESTA